MALGFSSALLITAFALVLFATAGAIAWGWSIFLARIPAQVSQPKFSNLGGEVVGGEIHPPLVQPVLAPHEGLVLQVSILPGQSIHFAQELFIIDTGKQMLAVRS